MADYQKKKEKKQEKKKVKIPESKGVRKDGKEKSSKDTNVLVRIVGTLVIALLIYFVFFSGTFNQVGFIKAIFDLLHNFIVNFQEWFNPDEHVIINESGVYIH